MLNVPERIQRSRKAGAQHGNCRSVVRGTQYGNDYRIIKVKGVVPMYQVRNFVTGYQSVPFYDESEAHCHAVEMHKIQMAENLRRDPAYYDKLLEYDFISCFCPLSLACHCDLIIEHLQERVKEWQA